MASALTSTLTLLALLAATSANAGLVPGGGPGTSDCYLELNVAGIENGTPRVQNGKTVLCTDGEACDSGACGDSVCTMTISACVNQTDANLPACTPPASLDSARINGKLNVQTPQLLQGPQCTAPVTASITATLNKKGKYQKKKSLLKLKGKAKGPTGTRPRTDSDNWTIQCLPRTVACPPPTTIPLPTTTTTTTTTSTTTTTIPCGNGVKDSAEECEGSDLGTNPCPQNPDAQLSCSADCRIVGCTPTFDLDFTNGVPGGSCGVIRDGSGTPIVSLGCGGLNLGGGISTVPEGPTPSGAVGRYFVRCPDADPNCTISATSTVPGVVTTEPDCTNTGCNFGTPLPIPVPVPGNPGELSAQSTCVVNTFAKPAEGTINLETGAAELRVSLNSATYLTGGLTGPPDFEPLCPKCLNGKCGTGERKGLDCVTSNPEGYTRDCPPAAGTLIGTIGVDLSPLRTDEKTAPAPDGKFCPEQGTSPGNSSGILGCFGQKECRSITETGVPAGPLMPGTPSAVTLASVFCIPSVPGIAGSVVNSAADLPGPGAVTLPGTFLLTPRK